MNSTITAMPSGVDHMEPTGASGAGRRPRSGHQGRPGGTADPGGPAGVTGMAVVASSTGVCGAVGSSASVMAPSFPEIAGATTRARTAGSFGGGRWDPGQAVPRIDSRLCRWPPPRWFAAQPQSRGRDRYLRLGGSPVALEEGAEKVEQPSGAFFSPLDGVEAVEVDPLFGVGQARPSPSGSTAIVVSEVEMCRSSTHMSYVKTIRCRSMMSV